MNDPLKLAIEAHGVLPRWGSTEIFHHSPEKSLRSTLVPRWIRQYRSGLQLTKHGIHKLIVIGFRANSCIESTVPHAIELGSEGRFPEEQR
jgi:hypothetical protein